MARKGPERGHFSRSRSLEQFNSKFEEGILEQTIEEAMKKRGTVRVLEIGCGEGRVLMELRKLFPNIELHGINKFPWTAMRGSQSLKATARLYKVMTKRELQTATLPKIHFYDVSEGLEFKANYFDLIYSQVAIQYVKDKAKLIEEIWRVLKQEGKAFLNIDTRHAEEPDFLDYESTPKFIIYRKGKIFPVKKLIGDKRKQGFGIKYAETQEIDDNKQKTRYNLVMDKNKPGLKLNLKLDELSSFNIGLLNREKDDWRHYWGYRSVYKL